MVRYRNFYPEFLVESESRAECVTICLEPTVLLQNVDASKCQQLNAKNSDNNSGQFKPKQERNYDLSIRGGGGSFHKITQNIVYNI